MAFRRPPRWGPYRWPVVETPPLAEFVLLSMLLHVLGILLFGAPSGGSREGRAMWGALEVSLPGVLREAGPLLKLDPRLGADDRAKPEPPRAPPATVPAPPLRDLGLAREIAPPAEKKAEPVPAAPPEAMPPLLDRLRKPERDAPLPEPLRVPPPTERPFVPAPPLEKVPVAEPVPPPVETPPIEPPEPARVERVPEEPPPPVVAPPEPVATPPVERAPVEAKPIPVPPPPMEPPKVEAPPVPAPTPPVERAPVEARPIPVPTPPVERAPVEVKPIPVPTPPVERTPVEVPALPTPPAERVAPRVPVQEVPSSPPAVAPPEPRVPPREAAPRIESAPPARVEREAPIRTESIPRIPPPATDPSGDPYRGGLRPPPSTYDPTAPPLDLEGARRRAGQIAREGAGQRAILAAPVPPGGDFKSKEAKAIEKAWKPDCRTAYQGLGLAAVVPLVANEFGEGNCRW